MIEISFFKYTSECKQLSPTRTECEKHLEVGNGVIALLLIFIVYFIIVRLFFYKSFSSQTEKRK